MSCGVRPPPSFPDYDNCSISETESDPTNPEWFAAWFELARYLHLGDALDDWMTASLEKPNEEDDGYMYCTVL